MGVQSNLSMFLSVIILSDYQTYVPIGLVLFLGPRSLCGYFFLTVTIFWITVLSNGTRVHLLCDRISQEP